MKIIRTHVLPEIIKDIRLEDYIRINFSIFPSRKGIQKSIKRGLVLLNHNKVTPGVWVKSGDRIDWLEQEIIQNEYPLKMRVEYEDDYLAIINKPSGIVVSGNKHRTVANALSYFLKPSLQEDRLVIPQPAHRLDAQTSGLLLIGKTASALIQLNKMFEEKNIKKEYTAIVQGKLPSSGEIRFEIAGRASETKYRLIQSSRSLNNEWISLVELHPKTGRTHQLRIHLSKLGFPIVGDRIYGEEGNVLKGKGLFLSATSLAFVHPITKEKVQLAVEPPIKFKNYIHREKHRWKKYQE